MCEFAGIVAHLTETLQLNRIVHSLDSVCVHKVVVVMEIPEDSPLDPNTEPIITWLRQLTLRPNKVLCRSVVENYFTRTPSSAPKHA